MQKLEMQTWKTEIWLRLLGFEFPLSLAEIDQFFSICIFVLDALLMALCFYERMVVPRERRFKLEMHRQEKA
jgi:hypothetical protein